MKKVVNLDSSQISAFLECPRKWYYSYARRLSHISGPPSEALVMGTYGHKLLELYYKKRAEGKSANDATDFAMAFEPEQETVCVHCKNPFVLHYYEGNNMQCELGTDSNIFSPTPFPITDDARKLVKKRFHEYTRIYGFMTDVTPLDTESVELGFTHQVYEDEYFLFTLEGKIDVLGKLPDGTPCIMDHKFQMRKRDIYAKTVQFRNYSMVADMNLFIINYIRLTQKVDGTTFERKMNGFTKPEREQWKSYLIAVFKKMERIIRASEQDPYFWLKSDSEPNWDSCGGKFGYPCDFTSICEQPDIAEVRINQLYHIREEWKPW